MSRSAPRRAVAFAPGVMGAGAGSTTGKGAVAPGWIGRQLSYGGGRSQGSVPAQVLRFSFLRPGWGRRKIRQVLCVGCGVAMFFRAHGSGGPVAARHCGCHPAGQGPGERSGSANGRYLCRLQADVIAQPSPGGSIASGVARPLPRAACLPAWDQLIRPVSPPAAGWAARPRRGKAPRWWPPRRLRCDAATAARCGAGAPRRVGVLNSSSPSRQQL